MSDSRYRITERVAAGGMAEVFKGVAESIQGFRKNVAIKRVLPALTKNKKFVAMFLDEARLSLHLQHANIVQVFDIGHADETYFIVMEFVDGVDLKRLLEWRRKIARPLTIGQTATLPVTFTAQRAVQVTGFDTQGDFAVVSTQPGLPISLAAGQTVTVQVSFTPSSTGIRAAALAATTGQGPFSTSLTGLGQSSTG